MIQHWPYAGRSLRRSISEHAALFPHPGISRLWRARNLSCTGPLRRMLQPMQEPAETSPALSAASFASLLASLAAPASEPEQEPMPELRLASNGDESFAGDIATLSYEQALRTHARYCSADAGELPPARGSDSAQRRHSGAGLSSKAASASPATLTRQAPVAPKAAKRRSTVPRESRKSASITIRLSEAEGAQLRARAAEAGLTVSAYLRSCAFEVEALRTQVKQALVELRSTAPTEEQSSPQRAFSPLPTWRARLFPRWAGSQRPAHA